MFKKLMRSWHFWVIAVAVLLAAIWMVATHFIPGLRGVWWRLLGLLLIALVFGAIIGGRWLLRRAADRKLEAGILEHDAQASALGADLNRALKALRDLSRGRAGYLYARPWYVIVGRPGVGKTTAIANSGLRFAGENRAFGGVGGTRNVDWWFCEQAVLLDTAGRFTSRDAQAERDAAGWKRLLSLLRARRPAQPLNGVIVGFGLDDLLTFDNNGLREAAANIRRLLDETTQALQVELPVYLVVTKTDLLPGFGEYFDDLSAEERREVLGFTLPWRGAAAPASDEVMSAFDELANSLQARMFRRLEAEGEGGRRAEVLALPAHFAGLRKRLAFVVDEIFRPAWDKPVETALRGVYFASGVQQGSPIDRVLGELAMGRAASAHRGGQARSYFLSRLLGEVVVGEAGLVEATPRLKRRRAAAVIGSVAASVLVAVLLFSGWAWSTAMNSRAQNQGEQTVLDFRTDLKAQPVDMSLVADDDLGSVLFLLDRLAAYPGAQTGKAKVKDLGGLGLSEARRLGQGSQDSYREGLRRMLLPRLLLRVENRLRSANDPMAAYDALDTYLMLGNQGVPMAAPSVVRWLEADLAVNDPGGEDVTAGILKHTRALLADPDFSASWEGGKPRLDGAVIEAARAKAGLLTLDERAYMVIRQRGEAMAAEKGLRDWTILDHTNLTSEDVAAFAQVGAGTAFDTSVGAFFTKAGYNTLYKAAVDSVPEELARKDLAIFGKSGGRAEMARRLRESRTRIDRRYADDYTAAWNGFLGRVRPVVAAASATDQGLIYLTHDPSPYEEALKAAAAETQLTDRSKAKAPRLGGRIGQAMNAMDTAGRAGLLPEASGPPPDAAGMITEHFSDYRRWVGAGLPAFIGALRDYRKALSDAEAGVGDPTQADQATAAVQMKAQAVISATGDAPAMVKEGLAATGAAATGAATSAAGAALSAKYTGVLADQCRQALNGRYPFERAGQQDVEMGSFLALFMPASGKFDQVIAGLSTTLTRDPSGWSWRPDGASAAFVPDSATQLQRADDLKQTVFVGGSASIPFLVSATAFGPGVTSVKVSVGQQEKTFDAAAPEDQNFEWSQSAYDARITILRNGAREVVEGKGQWGLWRLMDKATRTTPVRGAVKRYSFGQDGGVTFEISPRTRLDPFSPGGFWKFRCPATL